MGASPQFAIFPRMACNKYFLAALNNVHYWHSKSSLSLWFWKEHLKREDFPIEWRAEGRGPEIASTSIYRFVCIDIRELPEAWNESIQRLHIRNQLKYNKLLATRTLFNPLNAELNPICYLLALLGARHFLHFSRIRVKSLTLRQLMSYIYGAPILDVSRSHTTTQHSR